MLYDTGPSFHWFSAGRSSSGYQFRFSQHDQRQEMLVVPRPHATIVNRAVVTCQAICILYSAAKGHTIWQSAGFSRGGSPLWQLVRLPPGIHPLADRLLAEKIHIGYLETKRMVVSSPMLNYVCLAHGVLRPQAGFGRQRENLLGPPTRCPAVKADRAESNVGIFIAVLVVSVFYKSGPGDSL